MKTKKKIIEEFDEEFENTMSMFFDRDEKKERLRGFLLEALLQQKQEIVNKIEKMKKVVPRRINLTSFPDDLIKAFRIKEQGYNQAVSEIVSKLKQNLTK